MRVSIDAHGISRFGGGRTYMLPILKTMATQFPEVAFDVWVDGRQSALGDLGNVTQYVLAVRNRFLARLMLQLTMPVLSRRRGSNIAHFMKNLTLTGVADRSVVTIYDLHPLIDPGIYPASDVLYWRRFQPAALQRVDRIIAISKRTAQDLVRLYGIQPDKIEVIYPGIAPDFRPRSADEIGATLGQHGIATHYVLHVGAISPKKNLESLIRAFAVVKAGGYGGQLVLVGPVYEKLAGIPLFRLAAEAGVGDSLIITGEVTDAQLQNLMAGADLFVFPSMYEGFGLVVAEAMASGVAVLAARAGAVAEVVGDAAPIVENGGNSAELAAHMVDLLSNDARREDVARACLRRSTVFRLDVAARNTMAFYEESIRADRRPG